jgi:hypothetical protein
VLEDETDEEHEARMRRASAFAKKHGMSFKDALDMHPPTASKPRRRDDDDSSVETAIRQVRRKQKRPHTNPMTYKPQHWMK